VNRRLDDIAQQPGGFQRHDTQPGKARIAAVQMASGPSVDANLKEAERLIEMAAQQGAQLVALPEYFPILGMHERDKVKVREEQGYGPIQDFLARTARRLGIWIIGGSVPLVSSVPDKVRNSCLVYDDAGKLVARYDKIHLRFRNGQRKLLGTAHDRAGQGHRRRRVTVREDRPFDLLRPAFSGALQVDEERRPDRRAFRVHGDDRQSALGDFDPGACCRESRVCACAGAGGISPERP
jgi:hypothetical protein